MAGLLTEELTHTHLPSLGEQKFRGLNIYSVFTPKSGHQGNRLKEEGREGGEAGLYFCI